MSSLYAQLRGVVRATAKRALENPQVRERVERAQAAYEEARKVAERGIDRLEAEAWAWIEKMQKQAQKQARQVQRKLEAPEYAAILGVPEDADLDTIKTAYRKQMRAHHPDRFADDPEAEARAHAESQRIIQAYEQLCALHTGRESRRTD